MRTIIQNAIIINEGRSFIGNLVIEGDCIAEICEGCLPNHIHGDKVIDAQGMYLLPGIIDDHVHFRDPGLIHKADMTSESRAAAAGGVTSYMDMPNTLPQTTTLETLEEKFVSAAKYSLVNYSFFFGVTNDNVSLLPYLDSRRVCGVKLFMGSSTGNMLVDRDESLRQVFAGTDMLIMAHCEDQNIIQSNTELVKLMYGDDPDVSFHPMVRNVEACYQSTKKAVSLAKETGARLHIAHVSTARELQLLSSTPLNTDKRITAEACVAHLYFTDADYARLGTRIKCNPAIKTEADRNALRVALTNGCIDVIGTDHAPHLLSEKQGGCLKAVSGMPMVQFSLVTMLELVDLEILTLVQLVEKMCHAPATLFRIEKRGYLRVGYKADLVLVKPHSPWKVSKENILSKCGWSPLEGHTFDWQVKYTFVNGQQVYACGEVDESVRGEELQMRE